MFKNEFWKKISKSKEICIILQKCFNLIYNKNKIPKYWTTGIICLIYKHNGDVHNPEIYRGIKLLPICRLLKF